MMAWFHERRPVPSCIAIRSSIASDGEPLSISANRNAAISVQTDMSSELVDRLEALARVEANASFHAGCKRGWCVGRCLREWRHSAALFLQIEVGAHEGETASEQLVER